jgi:hypothetical protein
VLGQNQQAVGIEHKHTGHEATMTPAIKLAVLLIDVTGMQHAKVITVNKPEPSVNQWKLGLNTLSNSSLFLQRGPLYERVGETHQHSLQHWLCFVYDGIHSAPRQVVDQTYYLGVTMGAVKHEQHCESLMRENAWRHSCFRRIGRCRAVQQRETSKKLSELARRNVEER